MNECQKRGHRVIKMICQECGHEINAAFVTLLKEWISVEEKIPPTNSKVLAYDTNRIYIAYREDKDEYSKHWAICEEQDCSCIGCTGAITHWMPLPEPPTGTNPKVFREKKGEFEGIPDSCTEEPPK